ncbi:MAG: hypothetical protein JSR48_05520 [Verrucomicrobia bacterium]|nr:hypothetical protein [Verrucomicrobiota bacterium]
MKSPMVRNLIVTGLVALAGAMAVPALRAADSKEDAAERRARREAEMLKKYDANHDGKLEPDEKAVRKADRAKAKAEREAKKHERAEREAEEESK